MKKNLFTLLLFFGLFANGYSQDIISKLNGESIKAKVIEINTNEIKYKRFDNADGPTYTILKSDVQSILYPNGTSDVFKKQEAIHEKKTETILSDEKNNNIKSYDIFGYWQAKPGAVYSGYYYIFKNGEKVSVKKYDLITQINTTYFAQFSLTPQIKPDGTIETNVFAFGNMKFNFIGDSILNVTTSNSKQTFTFVRFTKSELTALNLIDENQQNNNAESLNKNIVAPKIDNDLKIGGLQGKIKNQIYSVYNSANSNDTTNLILNQKKVMKFNESGFFTEVCIYNANNIRENKWTYKYHSDNRLDSIIFFNENDALIGFNINKYSQNGFLIESKSIDLQGNIYSRTEYKYNAQGKVSEEHIYGENNIYIGKKMSFYDNNGNLTNMSSFDNNGSQVENTISTYDEKNRLTSIKLYTSNVLTSAQTYEYKSDNNVTGRRIYDANTMIEMESLKYDDHGNLVKIISDMTLEKKYYLYEYDKIGNITKKIFLIPNQLPLIEKNAYEYY